MVFQAPDYPFGERQLRSHRMPGDVAGKETGATQMLQAGLRISGEKSSVVNEIYARYYPKSLPARIFVNVSAWPAHFDIEIDCVAALKEAYDYVCSDFRGPRQ